MQEQRGNFIGIDTCNVTNIRNFKFVSVLLEEYKSISIRGCPDIYALLNQLVKEELISPQFADFTKNWRSLSRYCKRTDRKA